MPKINRLVIDATNARSDLCLFGKVYGTDKSPYNNQGGHRHPYTAIYDFLLSSQRYKEIIFGELGILDNSSIKMWRRYFPLAKIFGFEYMQERIDAAVNEMLPNVHYAMADVSQRDSLFKAFNNAGCLFDVLIDDSTHLFDHQMLFADVAIDFMKPGGFIIIEDVFREWSEDRYAAAISDLWPYLASATFVDTEHAEKFSLGTVEPYYNNDKLLVLQRNQQRRVP